LNSQFIERHSRQLILPGWTLGLQNKIASISVSVPNNTFLILYLKALGISQISIRPDELNEIDHSLIDTVDYFFEVINNPTPAIHKKYRIAEIEILENPYSYQISLKMLVETNLNRSWTLDKLKITSQDQLLGTYLAHKFSEILRAGI
jgi:hypothetical protein